jgi:hypothetical protein
MIFFLIFNLQQSFSAFDNMRCKTYTQNKILCPKANPEETLEHFSYFASENTVPSFNVPIWEPACFTLAFSFSPAIVCHLSRMHGRTLNLAKILADIMHKKKWFQNASNLSNNNKVTN